MSILREAAKVVQHGWTQEEYWNYKQRYCAMGAIFKVDGTLGDALYEDDDEIFKAANRKPEVRTLARTIVDNYPEQHMLRNFLSQRQYVSVVTHFNDDVAKHLSDVIAMLEKADMKIEEQIT